MFAETKYAWHQVWLSARWRPMPWKSVSPTQNHIKSVGIWHDLRRRWWRRWVDACSWLVGPSASALALEW